MKTEEFERQERNKKYSRMGRSIQRWGRRISYAILLIFLLGIMYKSLQDSKFDFLELASLSGGVFIFLFSEGRKGRSKVKKFLDIFLYIITSIYVTSLIYFYFSK